MKKILDEKTKKNRIRPAAYRKKQAEKGLLFKCRWIHRDDWPAVLKLMEKLNKKRFGK